jgi:hypothetical protein
VPLLGSLLLCLLAGCDQQRSTATAEKQVQWLDEPARADTPLLNARRAQIEAALQQQGVIPLPDDTLSSEQQLAQTTALAVPRFLDDGRSASGPLLTQIFSVHQLLPSDHPEIVKACVARRCYRIEKYNFAHNLTMIAYVALDPVPELLAIRRFESMQADIPKALSALAIELAIHAPQVIEALGFQPDAQQALMAATKTALNQSRCERSRHLCVAPTFVVEQRALWVIVDLTDLRIVGTRWTEVGASIAGWSEKALQNEYITKNYCERSHTLERDGWRFEYMLTVSDGLKISQVSFHGKPLFGSVKLVDWHVSYSNRDGFGYSDAVGCPYFSQAAVIAVEPPEIVAMDDGFELVQGYWSDGWPTPCNYNYQQRFQFYNDGSFRPIVSSLGRGCGSDGTYRPVTRIELAQPAQVEHFDGQRWQPMAQEAYLPPDRTGEQGGGKLRVAMADWQFEVLPSTGQFGDGGRGDTPWLYVTRHVPDRDEGSSDLITIGPCCNTDFRQGPERFIDTPPEPLADQVPVIWYVPELKNDGRKGQQYCWAETVVVNGDFEERVYPCPSGPMLRPVAATSAEPSA